MHNVLTDPQNCSLNVQPMTPGLVWSKNTFTPVCKNPNSQHCKDEPGLLEPLVDRVTFDPLLLCLLGEEPHRDWLFYFYFIFLRRGGRKYSKPEQY